MRGTKKRPMAGGGVYSDGAAGDAFQQSFVLHDTPKLDMPTYHVPGVPLNSTRLKDSKKGADGPNGERALNYVPGEPLVWPDKEDSPPSVSTYDLRAEQTNNIKVRVAFAGMDFDLKYQEEIKKDFQWWKKKDVVELGGNTWSGEHSLIGIFGSGKSGGIEWNLPDVERYVFEMN